MISPAYTFSYYNDNMLLLVMTISYDLLLSVPRMYLLRFAYHSKTLDNVDEIRSGKS